MTRDDVLEGLAGIIRVAQRCHRRTSGEAVLVMLVLALTGCAPTCSTPGEVLPDRSGRQWQCTKTVDGLVWLATKESK